MSKKKTAGDRTLVSLDHFIVQYDGKEQVELGVEIKIPGSWFNEMTAAERKLSFDCVAVEFAKNRDFGSGSRLTKHDAIRFQVVQDAALEESHPGYWIRVSQWNRFRHDTFKDNREAENRFIRTRSLAQDPISDVVENTSDEKELPPVYKYFFRDCVTTHTILQGPRKGTIVPAEIWSCKLTNCTKPHSHKVVNKSTGVLFRALKERHPAEWKQARIDSSYSKAILEDDGTVTEVYSFDEAFLHHIDYVLWIVHELEHFERSRSTWLREFLRGLDRRYRPPARITCYQIMEIICELMTALLREIVVRQREDIGEPFAGGQLDLWSLKNARESFGCFRLSMIIKQDTLLLDINPILDFSIFPENRHTADALARWMRALGVPYTLTMAAYSLVTGDGASPNKKSAKILKVPYKVCLPHDLQRGVLIGLGLTKGKTKPSENPEAAELIKKNGQMTGCFNKSAQLQKALQQDATQAEGENLCKAKVVLQAHAIRWGGFYKQLRRNRFLEGRMKLALTGDAYGLCGEEAADIVVRKFPVRVCIFICARVCACVHRCVCMHVYMLCV